MFAPPVMSPSMSPMLRSNTSFSPPLQRSLSWRAEVGLPPPPSEIDQYHDLQHALVPSSSFGHSLSPYSITTGSEEEDASQAMPMNAVAKHPKLKLKILLGKNIFEADGSISGALEVTSSTGQRLRLGEIAVEMEAFEELTSRDHSATQVFLFNRTLFQGEHLPPSNAVLPTAPVLGYWTARKGRTTFPFSFRLPSTAPSSVTFAGNAHLRYTLKATAQTWWNDAKSIVTARSDAFVVEKWMDEFDPRYLEPIEAVADTHIFMGGNGAIWLEAGVSEQLFLAGGKVMIRAGVKNNTKRHLSGIKVAIARRLIFPVGSMPGVPAQRPNLEPQITEVMHTQTFKGPSYEFPPDEEMVTILAVDLPRNIRTIRKTRLFEVQIIALISAQMGSFAKDLTVEIPIFVAHPSSLQKAAAGSLEASRALPQRSRSAIGQHGLHEQLPQLHQDHTYQQDYQQFRSPNNLLQQQQYASPRSESDPQLPNVQACSTDGAWSPGPPMTAYTGPPSRPSSAAPNLGRAGPILVLPQSPQPFVFHPGQDGQTPQLVWDAHAQGWTASKIFQHGTPRPAPALDSYREQSRQPDQYGYAAPKGVMRSDLPLGDQQQSMGPSVHPFTKQARSLSGPQHNQPEEVRESVLAASPQPQIVDTQAMLESCDAYDSSQQQQQQQISAAQSGITTSQLLMLGAIPIAGLATIDEDSESAVGTVRSNRSIQTLVGSVSRSNVAQFEAMVDQGQDKEVVKVLKTDFGISGEEMREKSLPKAPVAMTQSTSRRPRASDLFVSSPAQIKDEPVEALRSVPPLHDSSMAKEGAGRPSSAQGQGLNALEYRLGKQHIYGEESANGHAAKEVTTLGNVAAQEKGRTSESEALRAAAAARTVEKERTHKEAEERVRRESEQQKLRLAKAEESERNENNCIRGEKEREERKVERKKKERATVAPVLNGKTASSSKVILGERKLVDVQEQRKLNKEAVGRVGGWLSSSPSSSKNLTLEDTAFLPPSPKTPARSEPEGKDQAPPLPAGLLIEKSKHTTNDEELYKGDTMLELSPDLRALIDGSDARPVPRQGTAIRGHIGSRRFSGGVAPDATQAIFSQIYIPARRLSSQTMQDIPGAVSRGIPTKCDVSMNAMEKKEEGALLRVASGGDAQGAKEGKIYDSRSARGGRGGRVASVANLWASIADGTDGSQNRSDDAPVVTLKPKALRSGVIGVSALDFSNGKAEQGKKPTAREIFSSVPVAPLIVNDRIKSPPLKTKRAAHFLNTTIPKPVFVKPLASTVVSSPAADSTAGTVQLSIRKEQAPPREGNLKESRKVSSDLVVKEARLKAGLDLGTVDADSLPMNGRGTTKAIGREKLADLRSLWGN
ncbi:hypothetical protein CBS101457_004114 [Exobasidium rhododendri]|nr:hypothetical protein CBS101457_004114 [Exobasidium rhododendri]